MPGIGQYVQAQTPHLLETRNLKAGYSAEVVNGANITVKRGEVVALGLNGAGKSTTLLTIAGQLPPDGIVMLSNVPTFTRCISGPNGIGLVTEDRPSSPRCRPVTTSRSVAAAAIGP